MTLERTIGYSGVLLILIDVLPFNKTFVLIVSILLGIGMILSATYLRWKTKSTATFTVIMVQTLIPHLFQRLEEEKGSRSRQNKKQD